MDFDVVVVGGGPAGLATAISLGRQALRVLVCEQRALPYDKPCGEGLMPSGVQALAALGVAEQLEQSRRGMPFRGIRYIAASGARAEACFPEGQGWAMRRTDLVGAMMHRTASLGTVSLLPNSTAYILQRHTSHLTVRVGRHTVSTRCVVGADGLNSRVRRWAGLDMGRDRSERWGVRQHFAIAPWTDLVEVYFGPQVEAYIAPVGRCEIGVTLLWNRRSCQHVEGGERLVPGLLAAFPELSKRLRNVPTSSKRAAIGPLYRRARSRVADGVVLIGDAGGYVDAITGEGLSLAFCEALLLERTVGQVFHEARVMGQVPPASRLSAFAEQSRALRRAPEQLARLVVKLARSEPAMERVIGGLAASPGAFQHFLCSNMGLCSPWELSVPDALRLFRGMAGVRLARANARPNFDSMLHRAPARANGSNI